MAGYMKIDEETLKQLAKMYGYRLIKIKPYEKFEPCICGCNRRTSWSCWNSNGYKGHYVKKVKEIQEMVKKEINNE